MAIKKKTKKTKKYKKTTQKGGSFEVASSMIKPKILTRNKTIGVSSNTDDEFCSKLESRKEIQIYK